MIGAHMRSVALQHHHASACAPRVPQLRRRCRQQCLPPRHRQPADQQHHHQHQQQADQWDTSSFLALLRERQARGAAPAAGPGCVYLVGTGPGDPGLLTLRAVQLMQRADVVLYDRLVSDDILRLVHGGARMVYVGKQAGYHTRSQAEIHELLLQFAEAGATVVRLKGGDPYVFGRGGEEVQYLSAHGVAVHCVPGITAASGICAELGIPMTHRGVATSVRYLTGHAREGGEAQLDDTITHCADPHTTLIVYMGLATLPLLVGQLTGRGLSPQTPAVAVERGTTPQQRVVYGRLGSLQAAIGAAGLASPTLLVVGQVVALARGWQDWQAAGEGVAGAQQQQQQGACTRTQLPDAAAALLGDAAAAAAQQQQHLPRGQRERGAGTR